MGRFRDFGARAFYRTKVVILGLNMQGIYGRLGGRTWLLIAFFAVTGFILAWYGKLTDAYAALATALSGFHVGRAIADDKWGNGDSSGSPPS